MENASKALIIAGAILLSIAIIGIGMSVFNSAQEAVGNANMDEAAVATFNSKFISYDGTNVRGSRVNTLLNTVMQHNLSVGEDVSKQVKVSIDDGVTSGATTSGGKKYEEAVLKTSVKVGSGYSFDVTCVPEEGSGLITKIEIMKKGATGGGAAGAGS